ncbi:MAG TPA: pyridoxamine 5'-phosphate oxidase [Aquaticitalea sp.]|nr:pyridoxamine 5'-phosphate oxidase [Aquaticitalea sp.]
MQRDLSNYRRSYEKKELLESNVAADPIDQFEEWFREVALNYPDIEANALTLSTIGTDGYPKGRVVLLKMFSNEGFVFYTNYDSEKGLAIAENPNVCLSFFWHEAERQVIIKGKAAKVDIAESDAYFTSRPKGSQLGALVSPQSQVIPGREFLEAKLGELEKRYEAVSEVPRPENWGGYLVVPVEIEFWQGRANRLHDRIRFKRDGSDKWKMERLAP